MLNDEDQFFIPKHVYATEDSPSPKRKQPHIAILDKPMQIDHLGRRYWVSRQTPTSYQVYAGVSVPSDMPGIIIFVHGVNSEGEWYGDAEKALCNGLNDRLMRLDLKENEYVDKDSSTKNPIPRRLDPEKPGNSPVIRFYWGYRAQQGHESDWKIPLRNRNGADYWSHSEGQNSPWFWGGGPFQNGTNNLQALWDEKGFRRHIGPLDLEKLNREMERELHDAPGRQYYAHAVGRLAELIDRIRTQYEHDTLSIISHSQGTMVAMAAALACKTRAPDALFVMNSPLALEDKFMDAGAYGENRPTTEARLQTFRNVVLRVKEDNEKAKDQRQARQEQRPLICGASVGSDNVLVDWTVRSATTYAGSIGCVPERDNHGRFYVYFSPHDRVMGASPLQSIGWQGVSDALIAELGDTLKQRMLARGMPCGGAPRARTPFGQLPPIQRPLPGVDPNDFWNGNHSVMMMPLWSIPDKAKTVNINAEQVPRPLSAEVMDQCAPREVTLSKNGERETLQVARCFDQSQADQDSLGAVDEQGRLLDSDLPYTYKLRDRGYINVEDVYAPGGRISRRETEAEVIRRLNEYQPMPSNHSTLPSHQGFMRQVVAWDLPIGHCDAYLDREFWNRLMRDADWTQFADEYFREGRLMVPAVPKAIDRRTVAQEEAKKRDAWEKYGSA